MQVHESSLDIIKNYNAFIVDVWGVIHSSGVLFPNTQNAMLHMMSQGFVCLLSNAPRRSSKVEHFLNGIGIKKGVHYNEILTSGQAFLLHAAKFGYRSVFYLGPERDLDIFENDLNDDFTRDLEGINVTQNINDNFTDAIVTGLTNVNDISADLPTLQKLYEKNVTLSCINPDLVVPKANGGHELCAGSLALEFQKLGGNVKFFGKPYREVYELALEIIPQNSKILAIGDGIETDILGAHQMGIDSLLCLSGIHGKAVSFEGIDSFLAEHVQKPTFVCYAI